MPDYQFGNLPDLAEGDEFLDRKAVRAAGIHLALVAGIDGNPKVGASSIVLNGGYVDDEDLGEEIIYTGHGGNDPSSKKQIQDQSWDASGNKALLISELHGLPVRVTRGYRHKSALSPSSGYRYGGLYRIDEHFQETGKDGFQICRFRLIKLELPTNLPRFKRSVALPPGSDTPNRTPALTLRIIRDTLLSQELKKLYDFTCQVCGIRISLKHIGYAEAAHIKPLGKPHHGKDQPSNLLCLCPNHHVMFDKGIFTINDNLSLVGLPGELHVHNDHFIDLKNLQYHRLHIAMMK